jgi:hypothetical protein
MTILIRLNELSDTFLACRAVAYCDLSTGLVLCSSSRHKLPQEQLDRLGLMAGDVLEGDQILVNPVQSAIVIQDNTIGVVLRSTAQPSEALSCECELDIDLVKFSLAAENALDAIGSLT